MSKLSRERRGAEEFARNLAHKVRKPSPYFGEKIQDASGGIGPPGINGLEIDGVWVNRALSVNTGYEVGAGELKTI